MDDLSGGYLWLIIDIVGVFLLGAALVYGASIWRKRPRDPVMERVRDDATRRQYGEK